MLNLQEIQKISKNANVIFYKHDCPFCIAAIKLLDTLKTNKQISDYQILILDEDFENYTLGKLTIASGWQPSGGEQYPSKPQIYINGEYIGGNWELYKSSYNLTGPNLKNPMRF